MSTATEPAFGRGTTVRGATFLDVASMVEAGTVALHGTVTRRDLSRCCRVDRVGPQVTLQWESGCRSRIPP